MMTTDTGMPRRERKRMREKVRGAEESRHYFGLKN